MEQTATETERIGGRHDPEVRETQTMTTKDYPEPTRRSVLTSVGAAGVGGYGFLRFRGASTAGDGGEYTNYTLANTHGPQLLVGWYSTYNGHLRSGAPTDGDAWEYDATEEYVDGVDAVLADHPAVDIGNLLPGDSGTLSVGLFITTGLRPRPRVDAARQRGRLATE